MTLTAFIEASAFAGSFVIAAESATSGRHQYMAPLIMNQLVLDIVIYVHLNHQKLIYLKCFCNYHLILRDSYFEDGPVGFDSSFHQPFPQSPHHFGTLEIPHY